MNPFEMMRTWLAEDYPGQVEILLRLSTDENGRQPLLFDQVPMVLDFFRPNSLKISKSVVDNIHAGYSYLAAAIFCLDSVLDGHPRGELNRDIAQNEVARGAVLFFTAALVRVTRAFAIAQIKDLVVLEEFQECIAENMQALGSEIEFQRDPLIPNIFDEYCNITGRANIFALLFRWVATLSHNECSEPLQKAVNDFIFYLQLGDDVGDWREDYLSGRYTSFLRECFNVLGYIPGMDELEAFIYFEGIYERRLALIVNGLQTVLGNVRKMSSEGEKFHDYISAQIDLSMQGIKDFVECKMSFQNA